MEARIEEAQEHRRRKGPDVKVAMVVLILVLVVTPIALLSNVIRAMPYGGLSQLRPEGLLVLFVLPVFQVCLAGLALFWLSRGQRAGRALAAGLIGLWAANIGRVAVPSSGVRQVALLLGSVALAALAAWLLFKWPRRSPTPGELGQ